MKSDIAPVSGAWMPGDPPGRRRFLTFATDRGFALESGIALTDVTVADVSLDAIVTNAEPTPPAPTTRTRIPRT